MELEELKRNLRSKSFALDDVVPLARRAALAIEELQAEIGALQKELHHCRSTEMQLQTFAETLGHLLTEKTAVDAEGLLALLGSLPPRAAAQS